MSYTSVLEYYQKSSYIGQDVSLYSTLRPFVRLFYFLYHTDHLPSRLSKPRTIQSTYPELSYLSLSILDIRVYKLFLLATRFGYVW